MTRVLKINYDNAYAKWWLWWKVIFMAPLWSFLPISLFGLAMSKAPDPVYHAGHVLVVLACFTYFIRDLIKRTITVKDNTLSIGFRRCDLSRLESVSLFYKEEGVSPAYAAFLFSDGRKLKLDISRLQWKPFEDLLHYIETRVPQCKIDPVLLTLMKCKKTAGRALTEVGDVLIVPYNSHRFIADLSSSFLHSADEWSKAGPMYIAFFTSPFWISTITGLYLAARASENIQLSTISFNAALFDLLKFVYELLGSGLKEVGQVSYSFVANPLTALFMWSLILTFVAFILKVIATPNQILINRQKLVLNLQGFFSCVPVVTIPLEELTAARLVTPKNHGGPESWKLRFERHNKKPQDIMLNGITPENKQRILKAIERWAPHVVLDPELTEALLPRQERSYTELWLQSLTSAPERRSLDPLAPGQKLQDGRFEVIRCLGVGGQGTAYLCKDTSLLTAQLNTYVVLKETIFPVFVESSVRQQALERFEKEALLLSHFDSNNIVKLSDYFLEDHRGYLVLEHVDGTNLRQLVEEHGAISVPEVKGLARQMCDILKILHENGVVHRDFTPDNLILCKNGTLKLIDFNVAHDIESGSTGTIVGKHAFLPPEQFRGKATNQSDIYAMGATLFYLLTGQDPEPISQSSPCSVIPKCSPALDELVRNATALDCKKRYKDIEELRVAIEMEVPEDGESITLETTLKSEAV